MKSLKIGDLIAKLPIIQGGWESVFHSQDSHRQWRTGAVSAQKLVLQSFNTTYRI